MLNQSPKVIDAFTKPEYSKKICGLNIPLLVECECNDSCEKEIMVGNSTVYRYYRQPYTIYGKKYHICSRRGKHNKFLFKLLNEINNSDK